MNSSSTSFWSLMVILAAVVTVFFFLWRWSSPRASQRGRWHQTKAKIRAWLQAADQEQVIEEMEYLKASYQELAERLTSVESTLSNQGRLENLTSDVRQRLTRLEAIRQQDGDGQIIRHVIPGSIQRLGVRVNVTDLIWGGLGIVNPADLTDQQIDKIVQGPFCRNCLRSLIVTHPEDGTRYVRNQCRHCSLIWRVEPDSFTVPLTQVKREIYKRLNAEYRSTGEITIHDG